MPRRFLVVCAVLAGCQEVEPRDPNAPWIAGPQMPGRRLEAGVTASGTRLVVAGGFSTNTQEGREITREVIALDTFTEIWEQLPDAPVAWTHSGLAAAGGNLYLLGGLEGQEFTPRGDAFRLDLGSPVWHVLTPMPSGLERGAAAIVSAPPHIYVLGGASATGALASCLEYNLTSNTWSQLPDLPFPRSHAAAMRTINGTLIVAGGLAGLGSAQPLGDVWALPLGATLWEPRDPMPTARGGCAYATILGQLVCAGGEAGSSALRIVETYNPNTNVWTPQPDMPEARAGTQGAAIGQRLYVPGGANALVFEPLDTVEVFSLLDAIETP